MACMVESYNPRLAPPETIANSLTLPEDLGGVGAPDALLASLHRLQSPPQEPCPSPPLPSEASSLLTAAASPVTRAEASSCGPTADVTQLGRPTPELAARIHCSMLEREAALPPLQLASPQLQNRLASTGRLCTHAPPTR